MRPARPGQGAGARLGGGATGITLSAEQLAAARRRAAEDGLEGQERFALLAWRGRDRPVDRIVSVGMFEHVGIADQAGFFRRLRASLAPGGVALVHAIRRDGGPDATNPWLARCIFPGGWSPALSEVPPLTRDYLVETERAPPRFPVAA